MAKALTGLLIMLLLLPCAQARGTETVFAEAESFEHLGGWVVDQQFMDQMGSPYLLAHGLGRPVEDAVTEVAFRKTGTYHVYVRTKDWVACWKAPGAPGRFQLLVDGKELAKEFGAEGADWHWQYGGSVRILRKRVKLALHDLTGFEGRCDAVVFVDRPRRPPEGVKELAVYRKKALGLDGEPKDAGSYDLVVVGGGVAGICTAISSARLGLNVALVQDRPVLGGNNSSEVRVGLSGKYKVPPYPFLGELVAAVKPNAHANAGPAEAYSDERKMKAVQSEGRIKLFLNMHVYRAEVRNGRIREVVAKHIRTGEEMKFAGALFADCTGDGTVGCLAGADYRIGRESRGDTGESMAAAKPDMLLMGFSNLWYATPSGGPAPFPECPWALQFTTATCVPTTRSKWNWESGFGLDTIEDAEAIRDYNFRAIYGNWAFLKNKHPDREKYANHRLDWMAYIAGKRESRRLLGEVILKQQDINQRKEYPDACVTTTWPIDLHYPIPKNAREFPEGAFQSRVGWDAASRVQPYPIPLRCFFSRNVHNLMMAGRDISVTHVALGTIRVMATTGMMGEVVGRAAFLCRRFEIEPRQILPERLKEFRRLVQAPLDEIASLVAGKSRKEVEALLQKPPAENIARKAKVTASSTYKAHYGAEKAIDGDKTSLAGRWLSGSGERSSSLVLEWQEAREIRSVKIWTGHQGPQDCIRDYTIQVWSGTKWTVVAEVKDNDKLFNHLEFEKVSTKKLKMEATVKGPMNIARLFEIEVYE